MEPPLILFVNPKSGDCLGSQIVDICKDRANFHIVNLLENSQNWPSTIEPEILTDANLRIIVAGGDGSMNWVTSLIIEHFGIGTTEHPTPPIGPLPIGTGNDLSRVLGWGKKVKKIPEINAIFDMLAHSRNIKLNDVWEVIITRTDTGDETKKIMNNYLSIGTDAWIATGFEELRTKYPKLASDRFINQTLYVHTGFKALAGQKPLKDFMIPNIYDETDPNHVINRTPELDKNTKSIVFQAIPSIYSGGDLWKCPIPRSTDDGKIEVILQGGPIRLGLSSIGFNTGKCIMQATSADVTITEPACYQIDGEGAWIEGPALIRVQRKGQYPFIYHE